jgi:formylglycine-generating enzyme required for sulfatase activity
MFAIPNLYVEIVAAALFLLTSALVVTAVVVTKRSAARSCIWGAFLSVIAAVHLMMVAYKGEKAYPWLISRPDMSVSFKTKQTNDRIGGAEIQDCAECPVVVVVPSGWFTMGAGKDDSEARPQELPARPIRIGRDYAIGRSEITVRQFETFLVATKHAVPACWATANTKGAAEAGAACISWNDASAYVAWLSNLTGKTYRLPSAAEWEYAARAGSGLPYPNAGTTASGLQRVSLGAAAKKPNFFGLHDVNGGVAELTQDCWSETLNPVPVDGSAYQPTADAACGRRVVKDGMNTEDGSRARFSARRSISKDKAVSGVGFRVARELDRGAR